MCFEPPTPSRYGLGICDFNLDRDRDGARDLATIFGALNIVLVATIEPRRNCFDSNHGGECVAWAAFKYASTARAP